MIQTKSAWIARSAVRPALRAVPGASIGRVCGWGRAVAQPSSFAPAEDMVAIMMTEIGVAGGLPKPAPLGHRSAISRAADGDGVVGASTRPRAHVAASF